MLLVYTLSELLGYIEETDFSLAQNLSMWVILEQRLSKYGLRTPRETPAFPSIHEVRSIIIHLYMNSYIGR